MRRPLHPARGPAPPPTTDNLVETAALAEDLFGYTCLTPRTGPTIRDLAGLAPTTLAVMHGSCFTGDAATALTTLADHYENRLAAAAAETSRRHDPADALG